MKKLEKYIKKKQREKMKIKKSRFKIITKNEMNIKIK